MVPPLVIGWYINPSSIDISTKSPSEIRVLNQVSYLRGTTLQVNTHWTDPSSSLGNPQHFPHGPSIRPVMPQLTCASNRAVLGLVSTPGLQKQGTRALEPKESPENISCSIEKWRENSVPLHPCACKTW